MKNNHVVIMAGGVGSRFWPLSTPEYPKQFIDILGCGRTLIQLTVDRFKGVAPIENFWVVTNAKYVDIVKTQIPGIPEKHISLNQRHVIPHPALHGLAGRLKRKMRMPTLW